MGPIAGRGKVGVLQVVEPVLLVVGFKEGLAAQELIELRHRCRGTGDLVFDAHIQGGGLTGSESGVELRSKDLGACFLAGEADGDGGEVEGENIPAHEVGKLEDEIRPVGRVIGLDHPVGNAGEEHPAIGPVLAKPEEDDAEAEGQDQRGRHGTVAKKAVTGKRSSDHDGVKHQEREQREVMDDGGEHVADDPLFVSKDIRGVKGGEEWATLNLRGLRGDGVRKYFRNSGA